MYGEMEKETGTQRGGGRDQTEKRFWWNWPASRLSHFPGKHVQRYINTKGISYPVSRILADVPESSKKKKKKVFK